MKLTLEQLAPYLPYELEAVDYFQGMELIRQVSPLNVMTFVWGDTNAKILLRPLSDLTKEIEHNGERFVPVEEIKPFFPAGWYLGFAIEIDSLGVAGLRTPESWLPINKWPQLFQALYKWHFDVFGLIEKGLAVDINTIHPAKSKNKHLD